MRRFLFAIAFLSGCVTWLRWPVSTSLLKKATQNKSSTQFVDRHGQLVSETVSDFGQRLHEVDLDGISKNLVDATVAVEDQRFFSHGGVDPLAIVRALIQNARHGHIVSGGSTLTQQVARLLLANPQNSSRGLWQKLKELRLALRLESTFDKNSILKAYFNLAPYGRGATGVAAAAQRYFGIDCGVLSLGQAAWLAALPKAPSTLPRQPDQLERRRHHVLQRMLALKKVTQVQYQRARDEEIQVTPIAVPFAEQHAVDLARRIIAEQQGNVPNKVVLTIDAALGPELSAIVQQEIGALYQRGARSAAVVVLDNETSEIRALVGSAFVDNPVWGQFNAALAKRQPGSALKPFIYAGAFENGSTAATLAADIAKPYSDTTGIYMPENYDHQYHGPVRYREALAQSLNVAAVDVLANLGTEKALTTLAQFGLQTFARRPGFFGLGLVLGSGEVRLIELVNAYATLARGGVFKPWKIIKDEKPLAQITRAVRSETAYVISDILADANARIPQFGEHSVLRTPYWSAVKTGTSKGFRDNWTIGYTTAVTVGVWVGDPMGHPMHQISGVDGAGRIWRRVMDKLSTHVATPPPVLPPSLVTVPICAVSGEQRGPYCEGGRDELFVRGTEPKATCHFHRQVNLTHSLEIVPDGCKNAEPFQRATVTIFPGPFDEWALQKKVGIAERYVDGCVPNDSFQKGSPSLVLLSPAASERILLDAEIPASQQVVPVRALLKNSSERVRFIMDGQEIALTKPPHVAYWQVRAGEHELVAEIESKRLRSNVHRISVNAGRGASRLPVDSGEVGH